MHFRFRLKWPALDRDPSDLLLLLLRNLLLLLLLLLGRVPVDGSHWIVAGR